MTRNRLMTLAVTVAVLAACENKASSNNDASLQSAASASPHYEVENGWPILPEGFALSVSGGTAIGPAGTGIVYTIHSGGREWPDRHLPDPIAAKTIMSWDAESGQFLNAFGDGQFGMTHSLTVDAFNNIWATDVGFHQVLKFDTEGNLLMAIGTRGVSGDTAGYFNMPSDVAVLPDGSFYVSDGYGNSRIVKYSASGKYEFEWGTKGSGPGEFNVPHSLALDKEGKVFVADRTNARIQIFTPDGQYIKEIKTVGWIPYAIQISDGGRLFVTDGGDKPAKYPYRSRVVVMDMNGDILETFGRYGNYNGQFLLAHDIALGPDGDVYVADVIGSRVQKFTK